MQPMPPDTTPPMDPMTQPSHEDVAAAAQQEQAAMMETLYATCPEPDPDKPYTVKSLEHAVKAINTLTEAMGAPPEFRVAWSPEESQAAGEGMVTGKTWEGKIPPAIYLPIATIAQMVPALDPSGKLAKRYKLDPANLSNNSNLEAATGDILKMSKDKVFLEAAAAPVGAAAPKDGDDGGNDSAMADEDLLAAV